MVAHASAGAHASAVSLTQSLPPPAFRGNVSCFRRPLLVDCSQPAHGRLPAPASKLHIQCWWKCPLPSVQPSAFRCTDHDQEQLRCCLLYLLLAHQEADVAAAVGRRLTHQMSRVPGQCQAISSRSSVCGMLSTSESKFRRSMRFLTLQHAPPQSHVEAVTVNPPPPTECADSNRSPCPLPPPMLLLPCPAAVPVSVCVRPCLSVSRVSASVSASVLC